MELTCKICQSDKTKKLLNVKTQQIYTCLNCKNAFTYPEPEDIDYDTEDFHGQFDEITVNDLPRQWRNSLIHEAKVIAKLIPKGASILEIGAGRGLFLSYLKEKGFDTYGVEPSHPASSIAKTKGLKVEQGYYPEKYGDRSFDLIFMSHVLEHVKNPLDLLREIGKRNKGKYLILVQTNHLGIFPRRAQHRWYGWLPEQHFWHFTPKGIQSICKILGYKYIKTEYCTLSHNDHWISKVSEFIPRTADQTISIIEFE